MADLRGYVTAVGQKFEALAKQMGYPVTIGFIEVGDGKLPDNESPIARTALVHKLKQFPAIIEQDSKNPGQWVATCYIPADDAINGAGYFIREIGCKLIGQGNDLLYAYRRVSDDWKPVLTDGEAKSFIYKLRFIPSNGELLTPTIDPSVVLVDKEELARVIEALSERSGLARGNDGVKYALSAAAFRRDTAQSNNWFVISDTAHIPVNSRGIEGGVNPKIMYEGKKIGALILSPDETLALDGVSVGGSVGSNYALMSMGADCSFSVDLVTGEFDFDSHYFDEIRFGLSINDAGVVTLTHPALRLMRDAIVRYVSPSSTDKNLQVHYQQTPTEGTTTLFLLGDVEGTISYNGTEWVVGSSDQWKTSDLKFTWEPDNGVLLVEHGLLVGSPTLTVTMLDLGASVYTAASQAGSSSFRVKFRKHDGTVPSLSTALGFYFYRGESGIRKQPKGKLLVHLGHVQVNCDHFSHPQGNVWSIGLMEN